MTESKYLTFERIPKDPTRKTLWWAVRSKQHGDVLGVIRWFGRWRQYSFYPAHDTIFNQGCLRDIADFIQEQMAEWRRGRR